MSLRKAPTCIRALQSSNLHSKKPRLQHTFWSTISRKDSLAGTVPHHLSYVILHHPKPPSEYPPKIEKAFSPLYRSLLLAAARRQAVVNFGWRDDIGTTGQGETSDEESYPATIFSSGLRRRRIELPKVSLSNISQLEQILDDPAGYVAQTNSTAVKQSEIHLYVCTHGSRDCRCGKIGSTLVAALKAEVAKRQDRAAMIASSGESDAISDIWSRVRIGELAHVGGHKYAGNLLMFPFGDWLGLLDAEHAPDVLDAVADQELLSESEGSLSSLPPILPGHWRGRMGLDKEEQLRLLSLV